jgi:hypothetical protein
MLISSTQLALAAMTGLRQSTVNQTYGVPLLPLQTRAGSPICDQTKPRLLLKAVAIAFRTYG